MEIAGKPFAALRCILGSPNPHSFNDLNQLPLTFRLLRKAKGEADAL
jgi:hypothetical protein